jgi:ABC-type branched-subunit amino acid transport system permease subunit
VLFGSTAALGLVVFHVTRAIEPAWTHGPVEGGGLSAVLQHWVIHSPTGTLLGQIATAGVLLIVVALAYVGARWRSVLLPPLLYLLAVAWENVLVQNPSVTRLILLGALLIVLMHRRPQGLLGSARVEIV